MQYIFGKFEILGMTCVSPHTDHAYHHHPFFNVFRFFILTGTEILLINLPSKHCRWFQIKAISLPWKGRQFVFFSRGVRIHLPTKTNQCIL